MAVYRNLGAFRTPNRVDTLSSGEVNFLWWFIQGSIMDSDVRWSLRHGWGLCDRHTSAWLSVEAAFRHGYPSPVRCRAHLCAEIEDGAADKLDAHRSLVRYIAHHIRRYNESFVWEMRGSDTVEDRAALISAAGWCGGWRGLLALYEDAPQ